MFVLCKAYEHAAIADRSLANKTLSLHPHVQKEVRSEMCFIPGCQMVGRLLLGLESWSLNSNARQELHEACGDSTSDQEPERKKAQEGAKGSAGA